MPRRVLNAGEAAIFAMIQQGYWPQNTADTVFFANADEAVISVKAPDGRSPLMANLFNLAGGRADGTISSDDELKSEWLRLGT